VGYPTDSAPPSELQRRKTIKRERGGGLLEFVRVLLILLLLILGSTELLWTENNKSSINFLTGQAAVVMLPFPVILFSEPPSVLLFATAMIFAGLLQHWRARL
jgi:hypothetical protein